MIDWSGAISSTAPMFVFMRLSSLLHNRNFWFGEPPFRPCSWHLPIAYKDLTGLVFLWCGCLPLVSINNMHVCCIIFTLNSHQVILNWVCLSCQLPPHYTAHSICLFLHIPLSSCLHSFVSPVLHLHSFTNGRGGVLDNADVHTQHPDDFAAGQIGWVWNKSQLSGEEKGLGQFSLLTAVVQSFLV